MTYERLFHRVTAELLTQPWGWTTPKGDRVAASEGDYRITEPEKGARWSITREALAAGYLHIAGGTYEAHGTVRARQVRRGSLPEIVASSEGPERAFPGDWIVTDSNGNNWVVDAEFFNANYRSIDNI
jgi:hypothetical protein